MTRFPSATVGDPCTFCRRDCERERIMIRKLICIMSPSFLSQPRTNSGSSLPLVLQGDSPFGKLEAYIKLEQLGEGSYATVFKGYSK